MTAAEGEFTQAHSQTIVLRPDESKTVTVQPIYKASNLRFSGFPLGTRVHVNGKARGNATGSVQLKESRTYAIDFFVGAQRVQTSSVTRGVEDGQLLPGRSMTISYRGSTGPE